MSETPGNPREAEEREVFARDQQHAPPRDGASDVFAGHEPDGIPMTGEEDPLAEVDTDDNADIVAQFAATQRPQDKG